MLLDLLTYNNRKIRDDRKMYTEYAKESIRVLSERTVEREQVLSQHESARSNESDE